MNKYKILGLTFLLTFSLGVNAQQKNTESNSKGQIVMTKAELKSFLKMVAEKRLEQLRKMESQNKQTANYADIYLAPQGRTHAQVKSCKRACKKTNPKNNNTSDLSYQIQRVNDRLDNLMLALIGKGNATVVAPAPTAAQNLDNNTDTVQTPIKENVTEDSNTRVYISPERRSVLEELLAKYKNFKRQVFFANNSYAVSQDDLAYINNVVKDLKQNPELSVVLMGYASTVGSPEYNKQLSMKRAEAVANSITNSGISEDRIISGFYGEDKDATAAKARRVDMTVVIK